MTLPNQNKSTTEKKPQIPKRMDKTSKNERMLLDLFREKKNLTRSEVEDALGISVSSARRYLQLLLQKGQIDCVGNGKNAVYLFVEEF